VVTLRTNKLGQVNLTIDAAHNTLESSGYRGTLNKVDLIQENDDFFVFVTSEDTSLSSPVLHFSIDRSKEVKPSGKMKRR